MGLKVTEILPHKPPFLFLDGAEVVDNTLRGWWTPDPSHFLFTGHFPEFPIVPGAILLESMAQGACVLGKTLFPETKEKIPLLLGVDRVRFHRPAYPGESIDLFVQFVRRRKRFFWFSAKGEIKNQLVAVAEFVATFKEPSRFSDGTPS
jgi:3-hydroxyacyl-[acyl-carrier-protein] dehydratase